jgi:hypothetical protein
MLVCAAGAVAAASAVSSQGSQLTLDGVTMLVPESEFKYLTAISSSATDFVVELAGEQQALIRRSSSSRPVPLELLWHWRSGLKDLAAADRCPLSCYGNGVLGCCPP